jgi:hypothetical protein
MGVATMGGGTGTSEVASVLYVVIDSKRFEGDGTFGTGYAKEHPDLVAGMLIASSIDLAAGIIAAALVEDGDPIVPLKRSLMLGS